MLNVVLSSVVVPNKVLLLKSLNVGNGLILASRNWQSFPVQEWNLFNRYVTVGHLHWWTRLAAYKERRGFIVRANLVKSGSHWFGKKCPNRPQSGRSSRTIGPPIAPHATNAVLPVQGLGRNSWHLQEWSFTDGILTKGSHSNNKKPRKVTLQKSPQQICGHFQWLNSKNSKKDAM